MPPSVPPVAFRICAAAEPLALDLTALAGDGAVTPTFNGVAYTGGLLHLGWGAPVVVDLDGMTVPNQRMAVLRSHDPDKIVGHTESVEISQKRIYVSGVISRVGGAAGEVSARGGEKFPWQMSIGADIGGTPEYVAKGETGKANGQNFAGPAYIVRKSRLGEVSFVPVGADMGTSVSIAASAHLGGGDKMNPEFLAWLTANEYTEGEAAALTGKKLALLQAQWEASKKPPTVTPPNRANTMDEIIQAQRAENERVAGITEVVADSIVACPTKLDFFEEAGRAAIAANGRDGKPVTSKREFEILALRETRGIPYAVAGSGRDRERPVTSDVIEAAACNYAKLPDIEKNYSVQTLEAAHKKYQHGLSLLEMIGIVAKNNGWRGDSVKSNLRSACKYAFRSDGEREIQASVGPSTYSISGILSNIANKFLRVGFDAVESEWRKIASARTVNDFKTITSYTLTGDLTYEEVGPGGEIRHGTLDETTYSNKATTYAKMLGIDRRDLIDDSLNSLISVGKKLGRGGALKFNQVFWAEFQDDAAFFPTDGSLGNYDAGAVDSLLTPAGLDNATTIFRAQTDPDGNPLGSRPRFILVPAALDGAARNLMSSEMLNWTSTVTATSGSGNIWRSRYEPVSTDYLTDQLAWYLIGDPNDLPVIEAVFLFGNQQPQVESADMDFDRLGIALRGFHDFGVRKQEYRAGVKMKGQA